MKCKIYDYQLGEYVGEGEIFNTKTEAIERLINYFSIDCYEDLTTIRACFWKHNSFAELEIEKLQGE